MSNLEVREEAKVVYYYVIKVFNKHRDLIEYLDWSNMPMHTRNQFNWYFKYKAALLQVKYPRYEVVCLWGSEEPKGILAKIMARNRVIAKKRKLTEYTNKLQNAIDTWNELIPIQEHPYWCKVQNKINLLKRDLEEAIKDEQKCQ
jgi:hypothetical protein